jgi:hypothetical protein
MTPFFFLLLVQNWKKAKTSTSVEVAEEQIRHNPCFMCNVISYTYTWSGFCCIGNKFILIKHQLQMPNKDICTPRYWQKCGVWWSNLNNKATRGIQNQKCKSSAHLHVWISCSRSQ